MDWRTGVRQAFDEFAHHKLRTALTLLGMVFGVAAVISMLSIGAGAEQEALRMIDALGARNVIVEAIEQPAEQLREIREDSLGLTLRDLEIALETLPGVEAHTAEKAPSVYSIVSDGGRSDAEVVGVLPSHFEMINLSMAAGRGFTEAENASYAQVCVIGPAAARELFGGADPIGRVLKVNHVWLRVIGLLGARDLSAQEFEGVSLASPEERIYIPLKTVLKRFRFEPLATELDSFLLRIGEEGAIPSAARTLGRLLDTRHQGIKDFKLIVPQALLDQHRRTQRIFDIVMASIAGISLLVGGIGIMNIMLATVLERTREIGIRRAIGAKRADVARQFLIEALTVSLLGGAVGTVLGFLLAGTISWLSGWPFAWSVTAPALAFTVCAVTGLIFGWYPAVKAARLDPIRALSRDM